MYSSINATHRAQATRQSSAACSTNRPAINSYRLLPPISPSRRLNGQLDSSVILATRPCTAQRKPMHGSLRMPVMHATGSSTAPTSKLDVVLLKIDEMNSQDTRMAQVDGRPTPYELAYSYWLSDWVKKLTSDSVPSEELLIVARGQHVRRWTSPRSSYPEGLAPYLKWRTELKKMHAKTVTDLMREAGYSQESCKKVDAMIMKNSLKTDPDAQIVEDALCLVFLQHQFTDLRANKTEDKMVDILRKTWKKMGEKGKEAALAMAPSLCPEELALVQKALAP